MFVKFNALKRIIVLVVNHGNYSCFIFSHIKENKYVSRDMQMGEK